MKKRIRKKAVKPSAMRAKDYIESLTTALLNAGVLIDSRDIPEKVPSLFRVS